MNRRVILPVLAWLPVLLAAAAVPATAPSSQPAVESKAVENDGVAVTVLLKRKTISADEQPEFVVRFRNVGKEEFRNLYDVAAYWNWTIELINTDPHVASPGPWQLHMNAIPYRTALEHRQIKPGESTDVIVNLNDPPFTFDYVYAGPVSKEMPSYRHLVPGLYRITAKVALANPFGPGHLEWSGPVTTAGIELMITEAPRRAVAKEELEAYDAAIARVTDALQPGGMWMNGLTPVIDLPRDAKAEDVIAAAVNVTVLDSKDYRVLNVKAFGRDPFSGTAALLRVGKAYKVAIVYPMGTTGWWSRFYDTEVTVPVTTMPALGGVPQVNH